jgi:hypothetical protein
MRKYNDSGSPLFDASEPNPEALQPIKRIDTMSSRREGRTGDSRQDEALADISTDDIATGRRRLQENYFIGEIEELRTQVSSLTREVADLKKVVLQKQRKGQVYLTELTRNLALASKAERQDVKSDFLLAAAAFSHQAWNNLEIKNDYNAQGILYILYSLSNNSIETFSKDALVALGNLAEAISTPNVTKEQLILYRRSLSACGLRFAGNAADKAQKSEE